MVNPPDPNGVAQADIQHQHHIEKIYQKEQEQPEEANKGPKTATWAKTAHLRAVRSSSPPSASTEASEVATRLVYVGGGVQTVARLEGVHHASTAPLAPSERAALHHSSLHGHGRYVYCARVYARSYHVAET